MDRSIKNLSSFFLNNILSTLNLLDLTKNKKINFIHISTDEVFGSLKKMKKNLIVKVYTIPEIHTPQAKLLQIMPLEVMVKHSI